MEVGLREFQVEAVACAQRGTTSRARHVPASSVNSGWWEQRGVRLEKVGRDQRIAGHVNHRKNEDFILGASRD